MICFYGIVRVYMDTLTSVFMYALSGEKRASASFSAGFTVLRVEYC